jgi:hypothetical protein
MSIGVHFDDDERLEDEDVNVFSHWDEDWGTNEKDDNKDDNKKD